jgi:hypothetical protein
LAWQNDGNRLLSYLGSALAFFDSEDFVSTQVKDASRHAGTYNISKISDDDEMCRLMEEARSPPSIEYGDCDEIASDLRDASHHFSDHGILVYIHQRSGKWRRNKGDLEAAVRECQRVQENCNRFNEPLVTTIIRPRWLASKTLLGDCRWITAQAVGRGLAQKAEAKTEVVEAKQNIAELPSCDEDMIGACNQISGCFYDVCRVTFYLPEIFWKCRPQRHLQTINRLI